MEKRYCAAPWRGLHINFGGDVKTCCAGNPTMLGNLNSSTIHEILHSSAMKEIRQTIKNGRLHDIYCSNCIKAERYGKSERDWHNNVNQDLDIESVDIDYYDPTIIDIRWNNTCNLSCNYCHEYCSTKWLSIKKGIPIKSAVRPYYEQVCDFLKNHASDIREVAMVGGEPFLLPENERLLDVIPEDCIVTLITNMNVDLAKNKIFQKLKQRTKVGWSMSFDNVGEQFEYVRHGGSWTTLNENIDIVKNLMKQQGHWGGVHAVYNIYNCTRLTEFRQWIKHKNLTVVWQSLYQPECLDPLQHCDEIRQLAKQEVQKLLATCGVYMEAAEIDFFTHALANLERSPTDPKLHKNLLKQHIKDIEQKYHPNTHTGFARLWPELDSLLK